MPSSRRISAIAARPVSSIVASTSLVSGRSSPMARRSAPGLHDHHRDVVRHHVVQLARDPRPLVGDGEPGLLLALVLELDRARGERGGELLPAAHDGGRPHTANRIPPMKTTSPITSSPIATAVVTTITAMIPAAIRPSRRLV